MNDRLENLEPGQSELEEPVAEERSEDSENFAAMLEESFAHMEQEADQGAIVRGRVVKLGDDTAFVDLGGKSEGVIDINELKDDEGNVTLAVGDEIEATVVGTLGDDGALRLSRSLVRGVRSREMLIEAYQNRLPVEGKVTGRNKGGYEVQVSGMRAFVPLSQIDKNRVDDPDVHLNQTYRFRILEYKNGGKNVVLSRSVLQKEEDEERARALRESLHEGDVVQGTVRSIRDYGAFVDIGGMDGLLHVSEISWGRTKHPGDVLSEGDELTVQIIKYDREKQKLSLSLKQMGSNPWDDVGIRFAEGGVYRGIVTRMESFGAFVELAPGLEGLLHVSNMVWDRRVQHPREVVQVGDEVTVQILSIDLDKRRIGLGMKQVGGDPWDDVENRYTPGARLQGTVEKVMPFGVFLTLEPGINGLIPNSEMATSRGADHSRQFAPGQVLEVQVLDVNPAERHITLSRKGLVENAQEEDYKEYKAKDSPTKTRAPDSGSLGTIGSLSSLGDILAKARNRAR